MLDWSALRVVLHIHREGSMAGAAKVLKVSQPTLSRQLARAEHELGCKLFDRIPGKLIASEAGLLVARQAESIERQLRGMEDTLRTIDDEMSGVIRINAPQQMFPFYLDDVIRDFQQGFPDIVLEIKISDAIQDFASGHVDVVFRAEENPKPSLWGHRVARLDFRFYAHKNLLETYGGNSKDLSEIDGIPLIVHTGVVATSEHETQKLFPKGNIVLKADSLETTATFVRAGLGVARLPTMVGDVLEDVEAIDGLFSPTSRSVWILTHKDLREVGRIRRFIDFVAERTKSSPLLTG